MDCQNCFSFCILTNFVFEGLGRGEWRGERNERLQIFSVAFAVISVRCQALSMLWWALKRLTVA